MPLSTSTPPLLPSTARPTLSFLSLNRSAPTTLLLTHSGFTSPVEFSLLTPYLPHYHILLPPLPSHGPRNPSNSSSRITFAPSTTSAHLADPITNHAHGSKAHVVGISLGGGGGPSRSAYPPPHPDLVHGIFISGADGPVRSHELETTTACQSSHLESMLTSFILIREGSSTYDGARCRKTAKSDSSRTMKTSLRAPTSILAGGPPSYRYCSIAALVTSRRFGWEIHQPGSESRITVEDITSSQNAHL